jgi:hypothetical protein
MFVEQYKLRSFYLSSLPPVFPPQRRTVGNAHFPNFSIFRSARRKVTPPSCTQTDVSAISKWQKKKKKGKIVFGYFPGV